MQGRKGFLVPGYCQGWPFSCLLGQTAPWIHWQGTHSREVRNKVLARLLVTSLPPGHSSSSIYPLQYLTRYLSLESFQYYLDCKVWVSLESSPTCSPQPGLCCLSLRRLLRVYAPGRTGLIVTGAQQLISVLLKSC